jgi:hypothetical protein
MAECGSMGRCDGTFKEMELHACAWCKERKRPVLPMEILKASRHEIGVHVEPREQGELGVGNLIVLVAFNELQFEIW